MTLSYEPLLTRFRALAESFRLTEEVRITRTSTQLVGDRDELVEVVLYEGPGVRTRREHQGIARNMVGLPSSVVGLEPGDVIHVDDAPALVFEGFAPASANRVITYALCNVRTEPTHTGAV